MGKFTGVAYWSVRTTKADWVAKACALLAPLEELSLGKFACDFIATGDRLTVSFEGAHDEIVLIQNGQGRGIVRDTDSSRRFVACLVALNKNLVDIEVVGSGQQPQAFTTPRQYDPFFGPDWMRVLPVAQALGLAASSAQLKRFGQIGKITF